MKKAATHVKSRRKILAKTKGPKPIGKITHYFDKIHVGIIKLLAPLTAGKFVNIRGHGRDFMQKIESMQLNHKNILKAKKGWEIGIKVDAVVKPGDLVFAEKAFGKRLAQPAAVRPAFINSEITPVRTAPSAASQIFTPLWAQFAKSAQQKKETALPHVPLHSPVPVPPAKKTETSKKTDNWNNVRFLNF